MTDDFIRPGAYRRGRRLGAALIATLMFAATSAALHAASAQFGWRDAGYGRWHHRGHSNGAAGTCNDVAPPSPKQPISFF